MAYPGTPAVGMGGINSAPPQHQEKFDSAVEFLERVKIVYADQPAVYNQFLDIMKVRPHTSPQTLLLPFPHLESTLCASYRSFLAPVHP